MNPPTSSVPDQLEKDDAPGAGGEALPAVPEDPRSHEARLGEAARRAGREARALEVLRWIYLARIGLTGGVFAAALLAWSHALPAQTLMATLAIVITLILTPIAYWFSHVRKRRLSRSFLFVQVALDVVLVTLVVHLTGGSESVVAPLYIPLIAAYTLMLPLGGGLFATVLACGAYIADAVWQAGALTDGAAGGLGWRGGLDSVVTVQLLIFVSVAVVVGLISNKLREAGAELTSVEDALRQLRIETDDILGSIPTALLTIDAEGRLAYANAAAEQLLGIDATVWMGYPVVEEVGRRSPGLRSALERARGQGLSIASAEVTVKRGDETLPVGVSTAILERAAGPPSVTAIMRDISDRKRVELLRKRTERLEAVAELSAGLAHEIKNPLASISSSVQQLALPDDADGDQRLLAGLILKESERLSRLLSDFIDFARIQIERSKPIDLRQIARHAVEVVRQHPAYRSEIELVCRCDDKPVLFDGDEDLMHRVALNLVLNAVQAAQPGRSSRVEVEVRVADGRGGVEDLKLLDSVILTVSDDGPGIDEPDLERLFDPFFSRRPGGTGLGLAIVHRAVREHHGTVYVTSSPGQGTRFTVRLPRRAPQNEDVKESAAGER